MPTGASTRLLALAQPLASTFWPKTDARHYALLPSGSSGIPPAQAGTNAHRVRVLCCYPLLLVRRRLRLVLVSVGILALAAAGVVAYFVLRALPLPPLYARFHAAELALPQHDPRLAFPEGRDGRYLWVANHASKCGWGNAMQELFLNAYLAYRSNRAFVFDNYTWSRDEGDYSLYNLKPIPSRIPLTAFMRGPIVGGAFPEGDHAPRAVVPEYFYEVCTNRTTMMSSSEVSGPLLDPSAETVIKTWIREMGDERCVEVERQPPEVFDEHLFADASRLLDIWPHFSASPIVQSFSWSTLVELAFDNNRDTIVPTSPFEPPLTSVPVPRSRALARYTPLPGLLVLHIRRGDFASHCTDVLARRELGYTAFNAFPALPDRWPGPPPDASEAEKRALYARHCFPDIDAVVARVGAVRGTPAGRGLQHVYIMTNAAPAWAARLARALCEAHGWAHVASSRELVLTPEQRYVAQAVDMLVAQRAQVFIGNGFSTLSGMVTMLRMAHGVPPEATRHW